MSRSEAPPSRLRQPAASASRCCRRRATPSCIPILSAPGHRRSVARGRHAVAARGTAGGRARRLAPRPRHRAARVRSGHRRQPRRAPCRTGSESTRRRAGSERPTRCWGPQPLRRARPRGRVPSEPPTILVGLGGGQQAGSGRSIARNLRAELDRLPGLSRVRVLLSLGLDSSGGSGSAGLPAGIEVVPPARFREALAQATVAVVAGGTTLYEACALGTPAVAVPVVPGQATTVRRFVRAGLAAGVRGAAGVGTEAWGRAAAAVALDLLADASRRGELSRRGPARHRRAGCRAGGAGDRDADEETVTGTTAATMRIGTTRHRRRGAAVRHRGDRPQPRRRSGARAGARRRRGRRRRVRRQAAVAAGRDRSSRRIGRSGGATLAHVDAPSLRDVFARYELDEAAHRAVAARAREHGLAWLSSPFDEAAVDMLVGLDCDALKIASGDITHHRLIARAAATGKPLVISTGLSSLDEVAAAVTCAREGGARSLALLHCVSAYPTPDDQQNLGAIRDAGDRLRPARRLLRSHRRRRRRRRRGGARRQPLRTARQGVGVRSRDRRGGVVLAGGARAAGGDRGRDTGAAGLGPADAAAGGAGEPAGQSPRAVRGARSGGRRGDHGGRRHRARGPSAACRRVAGAS